MQRFGLGLDSTVGQPGTMDVVQRHHILLFDRQPFWHRVPDTSARTGTRSATGLMAIKSFSELFSARAEGPPPFLNSEQSIDGIASLRRAVVETLKGIQARRVRRGLLVCEDSGAFVVGLLALLHAGAEVLLPVDGRAEFIRVLGDDYDAVISDHDIPGVETLSICPPGDDDSPLPDLKAEDARIIFYTSGSTGAPSQAVRKLIDLENEARALEANWGAVIGDAPVFAMVPHNHLYGFMFKIAWSLMAGRPIAGPTYPTWEGLFQALKPDAFILTGPALLQRMAGLEPIAAALRPKFILTGGARVEQSAIEQARAVLGIAPNEAFGSTETGAIAWRDRGKGEIPLAPLPGVTLSDQDGCLVISAPYVSPPQVTADRVRILDDGSFEFIGREDRVVKVAGKRVNLSGLDQIIQTLPQIGAVATLVLDGPRSAVAAVVVLNDKGKVELETLGKFRFERQLRRSLGNLSTETVLPKRWRFTDQIPVNNLGKPTQALLAGLFALPLSERPQDPVVRSAEVVGDEARLSLFIPEDLRWFAGHFPDYPILPGVVQLNWAMQLAKQHLIPNEAIARKVKVKFRNVVRPGATIELHLTWQKNGERLRFEYASALGVHASGEIAMEVL